MRIIAGIFGGILAAVVALGAWLVGAALALAFWGGLIFLALMLLQHFGVI